MIVDSKQVVIIAALVGRRAAIRGRCAGLYGHDQRSGIKVVSCRPPMGLSMPVLLII